MTTTNPYKLALIQCEAFAKGRAAHARNIAQNLSKPVAAIWETSADAMEAAAAYIAEALASADAEAGRK